MLKICHICGKKAVAGKILVRKGLAKKKGGTGSKISRRNIRKFLPNLQRMRILVNGRAKKVFLCTKCIKKGAITRA
ncbi:MAG: 50S ribosomal protein L28 [Candidatus Omnitrophica bacterium]|jgi:large subunit ribosomal protein L28|nr:50S ribosomal protein L28 [Candidatus Omnitrophota bacterium]